MTRKIIYILFALGIIIIPNFSQGRNSRYLRGRTLAPNQIRTFNIETQVDIIGTIDKVENNCLGSGRYRNGIALSVQSGKDVHHIYIGPVAYLNQYNWVFKKGENIRIRAFKGTGQYKVDFFAAQVQISNRCLVLRDRNGFPSWKLNLGPGRRGLGRRRIR